MSRCQKQLIAKVVLLAGFWVTGCTFFSSPIDISGLWVGSIQWTDGPGAGFTSPITLDLLHIDRDLSGTVTLAGPGSSSFDLAVVEGRAKTVSMSLEASGVLATSPPQNVTLTLEGEFLETQMSGTGTQTVNGTTYNLTWEAVLVAPLIPPE